ncbi:MAG: GNAT family N-acetyltransferase [Anaerolineales bacterium]
METTLLDRSQLSDAVGVLSRAFANDPMANHMMEVSKISLEESLNELFLFSCEVRLLLDWPLLGVFVEGEKLAGVAGITLPGEVKWPPSLQEIYANLSTRIGQEAVLRLETYSRLADTNRPSEPHYQLGMIGVDPEYQGQGCGGQLLNAVNEMSESHPESMGVWLDTENPRNVPYYQRFGYEIKEHSMLDEIDVWGMFRPNQKG